VEAGTADEGIGSPRGGRSGAEIAAGEGAGRAAGGGDRRHRDENSRWALSLSTEVFPGRLALPDKSEIAPDGVFAGDGGGDDFGRPETAARPGVDLGVGSSGGSGAALCGRLGGEAGRGPDPGRRRAGGSGRGAAEISAVEFSYSTG